MARRRTLGRWVYMTMIASAALAPGSARPAAAQTAPREPVRLASATLRPGDVLRLKIWREPDWSGDYQVDETGKAVLPRLGPTSVVGVPAEQLKAQLVERYREFLNNPSVEVIPLRRISVLGAVRNPGMFPVDPSVTLGQAANVAGGPTPESKRNVVELRRGATQRRIDLSKNPELSTLALESGDQIFVPERSWLSRNSTWFVSTLVGIAGTATYVFTR